MSDWRDQLSGHSVEATRASIERARTFAKDDWERDFLHDLGHDLNNKGSITNPQRQRLEKILTRPSSQPAPPSLPTDRPCSYKGCGWRGEPSSWWRHAHEAHGRALPHWLQEEATEPETL